MSWKALGAGLGLLLAANAQAAAPASAWFETEQTAVRLVSAIEAVGGTQDVVPLGLEFRMSPGWKIYWRSPGDAGYPPRLDWAGSANLDSVETAWPAPKRFSVLGFETLGYEGAVVLPLDARPQAAGRPLVLKARLDYLTCKDICIPLSGQLSLTLPAGPPTASEFAPLITRWQAQVPRRDGAEGADGFGIEAAWTDGAGKSAALKVLARAAAPFGAPDVYVEAPRDYGFGKPRVSLSDGGRTALLAVPMTVPGGGRAAMLAGTDVTLTLVDGPRSAEKTLGALAQPPADVAAGGTPMLTLMLALAFAGGLILNLMPCVLPVLSLKLLSLVGHGGAERRRVRLAFLASAAGVVATFLGLAAATAGLKAAGAAVGWGVQFQQPLFLIVLTLMVTVFACALWDLFQIGLPRPIAEGAAAFAGGSGLRGHFAGGVFATLLATPCSAPFLGTAVGFALAQGTAEIVAIFAAAGLGLAAPYLLVAAFPALVARLPRPGPWMKRLRRFLGMVLGATALWLLTALAGVAGAAAALALAAMIGAVIAALLVRRYGSPRLRPYADGTVAALLVLALAVPWALPPTAPLKALSPKAKGDYWTAFDANAIPALVASGKTVLVDVTADWCLTCIANEVLVLNAAPVRARLAAPGVVAMRADWTRPDPRIAAYLASFGRYGIPFTVVYGPEFPQGAPLSELLTQEAVLGALDGAGAGQIRAAGRP